MNELIRAALVIARRDYIATVWSKTFVLFLIGPLFPILFAGIFGSVGAGVDRDPARLPVAVIADAGQGQAISAARERLATRLGGDALPALHIVAPEGLDEAQARHLLAESGVGAVLIPQAGGAKLFGEPGAIEGVSGRLALLLDEVSRTRALAGSGWAPATMLPHAVAPPPSASGVDRRTTARVGQLLLVVLTMILAGMLLSNLIEEKSNKVIEVLAAAVPVDAIFVGKLIAMLGMSLTGIAVWSGVATLGFLALSAAGVVPPGFALPVPALGWPAFVALGIVYFTASYLLLGAVFLGIGAQASTVREVQTLSMPVTMGQLVVFGFASSAVSDPGGVVARAAAVFPWSSPFVMLARAATDGAWWPHPLAMLWQAAWIVIIVRFAAGRFRRSVLNVRTAPARRRR